MVIDQIKDRRLEGETTLRQVQLTTLYLLDVIDAICREHGIHYFLAFGTLLGAMRHKGFIPWDDDLDVGMPESDYRRFLKIAPKCLPRNLMLQTPETVPGAFAAFAKLRDLSSLVIEGPTSLARPCGIYVDIFPYEKSANIHGRIAHLLIRGMSVCWRRGRLHRVADHRMALGLVWSSVCSIGWTMSRCALRLIWWMLRVFSRGECYREIPEAGGRLPEVALLEDELFPFREIEFEGRNYHSPNKPEKILEKYYGNWRMLPPESERQGHHSSIFYPISPVGFWWTIPHASLSENDVAAIMRYAAPWYLVKLGRPSGF